MKKKIVMSALVLAGMFLFGRHSATAQDSTVKSHTDNERIDSMATAYNEQQAVEQQSKKNSDNLSYLKSEKRESKAKARQAQRVEGEANAAARESKIAYRQEKKAQKTRVQADKQSRKAARARSKSDKN